MEEAGLKKAGYNRLLSKAVNKYQPYKPLWNLLPALHKIYKIGIIRNGSALTWPFFKTKHKNFDKHFDLFIVSGAEGTKKPNKEIYLLATKRLKVDPEKSLFIDDLPENIKGAQRVGMKTILWKKPDEGLKKLMAILNIK